LCAKQRAAQVADRNDEFTLCAPHLRPLFTGEQWERSGDVQVNTVRTDALALEIRMVGGSRPSA
jgi:hypothetical protein